MFDRLRRLINPEPFVFIPPEPDFVEPIFLDAEWTRNPRRTYLDVETHNGVVVAVWWNCRMLPFDQVLVDQDRAYSMVQTWDALPEITNVDIEYE